MNIFFKFIFRWASHGLDFLTVACQPVVLAGLTEKEFQVVKAD
jgi:hypothetical protein